MVKCAVLFCKNTSGRISNVSFHQFPNGPARKRKWVEAVRREQTWIPTKHHRICSVHFESKCYNENATKQRKLNKDAIPTLHLPTFSHEIRSTALDTARPAINEELLTPVNVNAFSDDSDGSGSTRNAGTQPSINLSKPDRANEYPEIVDTPLKRQLKRKIQDKNIKIKRLQYQNRCLKNKAAGLQEILDNLTKKSLITDEDKILLEKIGGKTNALLKRMTKSIETGKVPCIKYSPELRHFALTLYFYSPRAYKYMRKTFDTCLPAPHTLQKWYSTVGGRPGFTSEALKAIKKHVGDKIVYGALIIDEMKIMESEELHPNSGRTFGFEDFGFTMESDCNRHATEVLVFLLVALNEAWKVPIGYFATAGINAEQKSNLILTAVTLVQESGVEIKSLTFDGSIVNLATAKKLGCVLDTKKLKTFFKNPVNYSKIYVFLDPCHMLRNVRNAFESYGLFEDSADHQIKWQFVEDLHRLQDDELFHLANKLRTNHIHFKKKIMNVRLASQLFSESVSVSLGFCETELHKFDFSGVKATADFLKLINDLFDILDSRIRHQYGYKRAMDVENYESAFNMLDRATNYLTSLKYNGRSIMDSYRFTGFLGFCVCAESAKGLFKDLVLSENGTMKYLPLHKISQDHLEIFFANVRCHGGGNNNLTARIFESIYEKILVHLEHIDEDSGNCIPLEKVAILNCSSSSPLEKINRTTARQNSDSSVIAVSYLPHSNNSESSLDIDHATVLSPFDKKVVEYIAGFAAHKLLHKLKCDTCISALLSPNSADPSSLISQKNEGILIHPSRDTVSICRCCETELIKGVENNKLRKEYTIATLLPKVCTLLENLILFKDINFHGDENDDVNHLKELAKAVAQIYLDLRITFIRNQTVKKN